MTSNRKAAWWLSVGALCGGLVALSGGPSASSAQPPSPRPSNPTPRPTQPPQPQNPSPTSPQNPSPTNPQSPNNPQNPNPNNPQNPNPQNPGNPTPVNPTNPGAISPGAPMTGARRPFALQNPQDEARFTENSQRLVRLEQKMNQSNQEMLRRLGEIRQLSPERQSAATMELLQQFLRSQADLQQYLVQARTAWTGDVTLPGETGAETQQSPQANPQQTPR